MLVTELAQAARRFVGGVAEADPRLAVNLGDIVADAGAYRDIFRNKVLSQGGVYWFSLPDGTVTDIGKADVSVWTRICDHARGPVWGGEGQKVPTGEGWTFPTHGHLNIPNIPSDIYELVRSGQFHVGWAVISPGNCATLLEVYLQTLCRAVDGKLPLFCLRTG